MQTFTSTIISNKKFSETNFLIKLTRPKGFTFEAGQFVMLHSKNEPRPFSIASAPSEKTLNFLIKKHEGGTVSPFLYNLKKGNKVKVIGPYGAFTVKDPLSKELIFISAGTGIAPHVSMVIDSIQRFPNKKIVLIFGYRKNFYFENILKNLEKKHKNFKLYACCSAPGKICKGLCGRVTVYLKRIIKSSANKEVYLTGPPPMMQAAKKILTTDLKFKKNKIHTEKWI